MNEELSILHINSLVVKIASRCNLNCDYCYMYNHVDKSYKNQPRFFSEEHAKALGKQIEHYLSTSEQKDMSVCFHGGEPLLAGFERIQNYLRLIPSYLKEGQSLKFSIQTNGTLLNRNFLDLFRRLKVTVSISLDGPRSANDKHRLDHKKRSSYERTSEALNLLTNEYRDVFSGVLSVMDPTNSPEELIDFFASFNLPFYDILLPDANHFVPPIGRALNSNLYVDWIKRALRHWHRFHSKLPLRLFTSVCKGVSGVPIDTEIFGNGNVGYLIIETDGTYHYSDLLKAAYEGASYTGHHVEKSTIQQVLDSNVMHRYQTMLQQENLCETCLKCPEKSICGAGQISHRYGPNGFNHPTIYCQEMIQMIREARHLVFSQRIQEITANYKFHRDELISVFLSNHAIYLIGWLTNQIIPSNIETSEDEPVVVVNPEKQLAIEYITYFENVEEGVIGKEIVNSAFRLINQAFPHLLREITRLAPNICPIKSLHASGLLSIFRMNFLYVSIEHRNPDICAEMILYEFFNRKFMIFNEHFPICSEQTFEVFQSLYRTAYLCRFWQVMSLNKKSEISVHKFLSAKQKLKDVKGQLSQSHFSEIGKYLFYALINEFASEENIALSHK